MEFKLHNTLTKKKEVFESLSEKRQVLMYNCGPTVYGRASIGNLSSYIFVDFLRRWLRMRMYEVHQVKNLTDVGHLTKDDFDAGEDKMVAAAKKEGKGVEEVAKKYIDLYIQDEKELHLLEPEARPKASEYVPQQIEMVEQLIEKGHAYEVEGNVYYDVTSFSDYGKLSGNKLEDLEAGARVDIDSNKRNPSDFLLWRKAEPDHLMQWDSPWGKGYPGWHIECSAMARELLGETIDIHTGGEDNIFPHHESEIAQSESLTGKPFAKFWVHRRHILIDGKKMSKSLGNVYSLDDIKEKGFHPLVFKFLVFSSHYRSKLDFSWTAMEQAREGLDRIMKYRERIHHMEPDMSSGTHELEAAAQERVDAAMNDDLNTPEALAVLYDFVRDANALLDKGGDEAAAFVLSGQHFLARFDRMLGVFEKYPFGSEEIDPELRKEVEQLLEERKAARNEKNFGRADEIREELGSLGVEINDTDTETTWRLT